MALYHKLVPLEHSTDALIDALLVFDRRVLLFGEAGAGKSTLATGLALTLAEAGRACWCLSADPGSPAFGVPGALCLGKWRHDHWRPLAFEALCSLDAARFRLPLVAAVRRLAERVPAAATLLVDPAGITRSVAGAELLAGVAEAARIDAVLVLAGASGAVPLPMELQALALELFVTPVAAEARQPGKPERARRRTRLWDVYLQDAEESVIELNDLVLVGTPPPTTDSAAWRGRQIALMDEYGATLALGEVSDRKGEQLGVRTTAVADGEPRLLLVRDARRSPDGLLRTERRAAPSLQNRAPVDMLSPASGAGSSPVVQLGSTSVALVNGLFGDPLLHVRLRHLKRSLLFDLGESGRLATRILHQVSDVFISHAHFDHIAGFLWLLRARISLPSLCRIYGPPGLTRHIAGLVSGILWDRIGDRGPRFEVAELHGERLLRFRIQAGLKDIERLSDQAATGGVLLTDPAFRVRAAVLDHGVPVLAFAYESSRQFNIRKERLQKHGLAAGPWLGELKQRLLENNADAVIQLPNGSVERVRILADELVLTSPGQKIVYATDLADTLENRRRLTALASQANLFFCEATFVQADAEQSKATGHLTARACGEIATAAGVERLVPFHFSKRYDSEPERVYREVRAANQSI